MIKEYVSQFPDGTHVRWRPLTWCEYKALTKQFGDLQGVARWLLFEAAAALCVLDVEGPDGQDTWSEAFAGTIAIVGSQILEESGFDPSLEKINSRLNHYRAVVENNFWESALAVVSHAFHYKTEELDTWTLDKLSYHIVLAEQLGLKISPKPVGEEQKFIEQDGKRIPLISKKRSRR